MKKHLFSLICLLLALTLAWQAAFAETGETAAYAIGKKNYPYNVPLEVYRHEETDG